MNIEVLEVGKFKCNCYLLIKKNKVLIIDPGDDGDKIISRIGNKEVVGIIITHYHFDHIGAIDILRDKYNVFVYDKNNMLEGENQIDDFNFDVIYTPGHKEDAITIYFKEKKLMFCGDFIFRDNIGRCDLPGGDIEMMKESISKIKNYDNDIEIYPGHGSKTNLGYEIENNLYFLDINML